ncbi:Uncharacterised protein [Mycobacterium tuberculosis]|uniref:Uncharacterized protein n=1 Tax=Mycobacterium tuberculosis TaxID=1773 RepID=A0A655AAS2_MYCTX|nr:Uncharacterised protein [Mycobacterium tuberculosis]CKM51237.1 Uncharacterised protein [Mycobacterium tuberculosis]CKR53345.1 Uncharacterised protein [Mycobacterium tuberculosis]CKS20630.1 Uncharacterised protein [Mycobacterium tuberculosis]CKS22516.1 Uncharacterised protein [Mycobacterium tuberculosis]
MLARNWAYGSSVMGPALPTMRRYMLVNRRLVSWAKSAAPGLASTRSTASVMPTSRIVSIMPGIDWVAPERTLTSSGFGPRPNVHEVSVSSQLIRSSTSSQIAAIVDSGAAR